MDPTTIASTGVSSLITNSNVAITALAVIAIFEASLIWFLLKGIFNFQEVLKELEVSIRILNERINHKGE